MTHTASKPRKPRLAAGLLAPALIAAALFHPAPAAANCLVSYADCVEAAAELDTVWKRSAQGLVCFVDLVGCLQRQL